MEAKKKKLPVRQCLGCGEHKLKRELLRVVRDPDGGVSLDFTGKKNGRGAYICRDVKCLRRARKSRRLEHNLGCDIPDEIYVIMESELEDCEGNGKNAMKTNERQEL